MLEEDVPEVRLPSTYSEYRLLTNSDKTKTFGVTEGIPVNDIVKVIRDYYDSCGHAYDFDDLISEADMIFKVAHRDIIYEAAVRITKGMQMLSNSYENVPVGVKVALF